MHWKGELSSTKKRLGVSPSPGYIATVASFGRQRDAVQDVRVTSFDYHLASLGFNWIPIRNYF